MSPTRHVMQKDTSPQPRSAARSLALLLLVNAGVLLLLLVPVELIFGTWVRPMALSDLKRFSIPVGTTFEFDTSTLYTGGPRNPIKYTRDEWGLRGTHGQPRAIDVLTVGGSTTEQRYLDDLATWQEVARRELERQGRPLVIANAGVDGQSTIGHAFDFTYWFPLIPDLQPRVILFYVGANDVLRSERRDEFDSGLDATSWRVRSVTFQLFRTVRSNMRAREVRVMHGRMPPPSPSDYTADGLLGADERAAMAREISSDVLRNVDGLRRRVLERGATPVFMTQTARSWNADRNPPRGLRETVRIRGRILNYADVGFLHQDLNRGLLEYCAKTGTSCFDLANEVTFGVDDYYDYLHNTPSGAEKIGRYLAERLRALDVRVGARQ